MSYVDLMGTVRWTEQDHTNRSEAYVRAQISHAREHILMRRLFAFLFYVIVAMLPDGSPLKDLLVPYAKPLPDAAVAELGAAAVVYGQSEAIADAGRADGARLNAVLDIEDVQAAIAAIPPAPADGGEDLLAEARAQAHVALQALVDAAPADALQLLADRAAARAPAADPAESA